MSSRTRCQTYTIRIVEVDHAKTYFAYADSAYSSEPIDTSLPKICSGNFESMEAAIRFCSEQVLMDRRPVTGEGDPFEPDAEVIQGGFLPYGEVVYFLQSENGGPIKIGWSADVKLRIEQFQPGCPYLLKTLLCVRGGYYDEQIIHNKFSHLRLHGEWFAAGDELLKFIDSIRKKKRITKNWLSDLARENGATDVSSKTTSDENKTNCQPLE